MLGATVAFAAGRRFDGGLFRVFASGEAVTIATVSRSVSPAWIQELASCLVSWRHLAWCWQPGAAGLVGRFDGNAGAVAASWATADVSVAVGSEESGFVAACGVAAICLRYDNAALNCCMICGHNFWIALLEIVQQPASLGLGIECASSDCTSSSKRGELMRIDAVVGQPARYWVRHWTKKAGIGGGIALSPAGRHRLTLAYQGRRDMAGAALPFAGGAVHGRDCKRGSRRRRCWIRGRR